MDFNQSLFIAHRGESFDAPENTLGAINLAWERGDSAVEIDIHLTADNEICVIHDYNTQRVTGVKKLVIKSTMNELRMLNAGFFKGETWKNERIPSLTEVLKTVPINGKLIIEIKSNERILLKLKEELDNSKLDKKQIEIIAFNFKTLAKAKKIMPEYRMLWLLVPSPLWVQYLFRRYPKSIIKRIKKYNLDGINVGDSQFFTSKFIAKIKAANLLVYTWTVDNPKRAKELLENGVDCITTNRAWWIAGELSKQQ